MNRILLFAFGVFCCMFAQSCSDHDDPQLAPIDTTQVKIKADVSQSPKVSWMTNSEELTIRVSDIEMTAPKGVVLRSISLLANTSLGRQTIDDKPYSGEPLEFKIPLVNLHGRVNFSLRGNLIKQNSRDAEIIIADNIQEIVFSEEPKLECEGWLKGTVRSTSTSGEEYEHSFEVKSDAQLDIKIPQSDLYWTPKEGTASTIEVTLESSASAWSSNTTFECGVTKTAIGYSSAAPATYTATLPNKPGALNAEKLQFYVHSTYFGTWENVTIDPYNLTTVYFIVESN